MKTLVIYYSRKGQNYVSGSIQNLKKGNTEIVAEYVQAAVGADLFQIETVNDYSENYRQCTEEAKAEIQNQSRPALVKMLDSIDEYDNIVVAGPCWWGTYPMAVFTQLEALDFTGKNVFAIMTHEGSGLANSVRDLKKYCKGAHVGKGLAVHGTDAKYAQAEVAEWAAENLQ